MNPEQTELCKRLPIYHKKIGKTGDPIFINFDQEILATFKEISQAPIEIGGFIDFDLNGNIENIYKRVGPTSGEHAGAAVELWDLDQEIIYHTHPPRGAKAETVVSNIRYKGTKIELIADGRRFDPPTPEDVSDLICHYTHGRRNTIKPQAHLVFTENLVYVITPSVELINETSQTKLKKIKKEFETFANNFWDNVEDDNELWYYIYIPDVDYNYSKSAHNDYIENLKRFGFCDISIYTYDQTFSLPITPVELNNQHQIKRIFQILTVKDLKEIARNIRIRGLSKLRRNDLVEKILQKINPEQKPAELIKILSKNRQKELRKLLPKSIDEAKIKLLKSDRSNRSKKLDIKKAKSGKYLLRPYDRRSYLYFKPDGTKRYDFVGVDDNPEYPDIPNQFTATKHVDDFLKYLKTAKGFTKPKQSRKENEWIKFVRKIYESGNYSWKESVQHATDIYRQINKK